MSSKKKQRRIQRTAETIAAPPPVDTGAAPASSAPDQNRWRWWIILGSLLGLSVLILFLSWIKFFDLVGLDRRLQDTLISYVGTNTSDQFDSRVELILVDKEEQANQPFGNPSPKHRTYHASMTRLLTKDKAKVIVFDVEFKTSSPDDQDFAQALQEAEKAGTKIMVGGFLEAGEYEPQIAATLKQAIGDHWGIVDGGIPKSESEARFIRLVAPKNSEPRTIFAEQPVIPSLALQAVRMLHYPKEDVTAWYNTLAGEVRLRSGTGQPLESIPVNSETCLLVDLPGKNEIPRESYQNVLAHPDDFAGNFKNKIVVIAYQAKDDLPFSDSEKQVRYGSEYHATAISTILSGAYLRPVSLSYHYITILLLVAIAACLEIRFSKWMNQKMNIPLPFGLPAPLDKIPIPIALVVISLAYFLCAILAFKLGHIVFDMSYHLAALILTHYLFVFGRSRFTRK